MRVFVFMLLLHLGACELVLYPNVIAFDQEIHAGETLLYALETTEGQEYEIKVSYKATTPSQFHLQVIPEGRRMRRILNTEKTFVKGLNGKQQYVQVEMQIDGISYTIPNLHERVTKFDILLEPLVLGAIPQSTLPLIGVILVLLAFMVLVVYPRVSSLLIGKNEHGIKAT